MQVDDVRKERTKIELELSELISVFEKRTGTLVKHVEIYRMPTYTGFSENLGAITVQIDVRI